MTTPTRPISLQDIKNEFNPTGTGVIRLSDYYAGGPYVSNPPPTSVYQTAPIPISGKISLGCFLGLSAITYVSAIEGITQFFNINYSGAENVNWGKSAHIAVNSGDVGQFTSTGGNDSRVGSCPTVYKNMKIGGFYRSGTWTTFFIANASGDGLKFISTLGDNGTLTNDFSLTFASGSDLWTAYAFQSGVSQAGANRNLQFALVGTASRAQPANGTTNQPYIPPPPPTGETSPGTCFPAGSMVLMGNGKLKSIETIQAGEFVMGMNGPTVVTKVDTPILGHRKMLAFSDGHKWSEEHAHWTKNTEDSQFWWSYNKQKWIEEAQNGFFPGLRDNNRLRTGEQAAAFAHVDGWKVNQILDGGSYPSDFILYMPFTSGSPIIIDGYVVSAGVDESGFNYDELDWDAVQKTL